MAAIAFQPETSNNLKVAWRKVECKYFILSLWTYCCALMGSHCSEAPMSFSRQVVPGFDKAVRGLKAGDLAGMHCRL